MGARVDDRVSFPSPYSVHQAVERLGAAVKPTALHTPFREAVVGRVSEMRVRLRRHRQMMPNGFAPVFSGAFVTRDGQTRLEGRFGLHPMVRIYVTLWYGILAVMVGVYTTAALRSGPMRDTAMFAAILVTLAVFPAAMIRVGRWLGRRDVDYIADVIRRGLSDSSKAV
ncbi:MAG: hypothetical protein ACRELS_07955 [Candidatus Rokuibacteriota bacterium]